ncbi:MAG: hypothetical protein MUO67_09745, partial [Anaerolineales bacterium]|nr:hypothetical protein [Anaerolineales bacterium]
AWSEALSLVDKVCPQAASKNAATSIIGKVFFITMYFFSILEFGQFQPFYQQIIVLKVIIY